MIEHNACLLSEAAATALAAVLGLDSTRCSRSRASHDDPVRALVPGLQDRARDGQIIRRAASVGAAEGLRDHLRVRVRGERSNGDAKHREMLGQALADARLGRFEVMLVWALDRVSCEGVEVTLGIFRRFACHGTAVWSLKESWTETALVDALDEPPIGSAQRTPCWPASPCSRESGSSSAPAPPPARPWGAPAGMRTSSMPRCQARQGPRPAVAPAAVYGHSGNCRRGGPPSRSPHLP